MEATLIIFAKCAGLLGSTVLVCVALTSCLGGGPGAGGGKTTDLSAKDYCSEIIKLVNEFNAIAFDGYLNDDAYIMDDLAFSAKKLSRLVKRAESEGVDLANPEFLWLKNLGLSADSFIVLAQAGPDTFSDEELRGYLERIIGWYDAAAKECRVVAAQSLSLRA